MEVAERSPGVIDAHVHLWDPARFAYDWDAKGLPQMQREISASMLEAEMRATGTHRAVVVQVLPSDRETTWLLQLLAEHDVLAGVVGWVDLTQDSNRLARDLTERVGAEGFVGIRHPVTLEPDAGWLLRPDVQRGLGVLESLDVPFDLLLRPDQLDQVRTLSERLPRLRMVLNHMGNPDLVDGDYHSWRATITSIAENPNIACKVSGLLTGARGHDIRTASRYASTLLEAFGPHRLLYATDWPICTLFGGYADARAAFTAVFGPLLSAQELVSIERISAETWYRLPKPRL